MSNDVTPEQKARMVMFAGLNYSGAEIAEKVGVSESSVYRYLNEFEERAKQADASDSGTATSEEIYWEVMLAGMFGGSFARRSAKFMSEL